MNVIQTCEMHCGGEPVRIIERGYPPIPKLGSILEVRRYVQTNYDKYRKMLLWEPRGHSEMYGALLVEPTKIDSDAGVLFMHNSGYSTMCGHATIALARYLFDKKLLTKEKKDSLISDNQQDYQIVLETPCGDVRAWVAMEGPEKHSVMFLSVESYAVSTDLNLIADGLGNLKVDIAYGGAFYIILNAKLADITFGKTPVSEMIQKATVIKKKADEIKKVKQPIHEDLSFLYGVIFTDDTQIDNKENPTVVNCCIFAEGQVDRSPCGSGVTAQMALLHKKGKVSLGNMPITFVSAITGSQFTGKINQEVKWCDKNSVIVEVKGRAFYTGKCEFTYEPDDNLAFGFHV